MGVIKVGKCYCCGGFGRLRAVNGRELCNECVQDHKKTINIINTILRPRRSAR